MSEIFDLRPISSLINREKPALIVIVDTGVMLEEPGLKSWKIGKEVPLFVLPCNLEKEIEHLKNLPISRDQACLAENEVKSLCENQQIQAGVFKEPAGWFISPPAPKPRILKTELAKIPFLSRSLGYLSSQLVVLAQEIRLKFLEIPLGVITRDINLFNILQFMGVQVVLYEKFPISGFPAVKKPVAEIATNWDKLLQEIQVETEKNLVNIELTLSSKSLAPKWMINDSQKNLIVAEGKGVVHAYKDIHFTWSLPFHAWDFPLPKSLQDEEAAPSMGVPDSVNHGTVYLDFNGAEEALPSDIYDALERKIDSCASPLAYIEELPTLQDPISVLKQFLVLEYAYEERKERGDVAPDDVEELEQRLKDTDNLLNFAFFWLRERDAGRDELDVSFSELLNALQSCWNIGQSFTFDIMRNETVNNTNNTNIK